MSASGNKMMKKTDRSSGIVISFLVLASAAGLTSGLTAAGGIDLNSIPKGKKNVYLYIELRLLLVLHAYGISLEEDQGCCCSVTVRSLLLAVCVVGFDASRSRGYECIHAMLCTVMTASVL